MGRIQVQRAFQQFGGRFLHAQVQVAQGDIVDGARVVLLLSRSFPGKGVPGQFPVSLGQQADHALQVPRPAVSGFKILPERVRPSRRRQDAEGRFRLFQLPKDLFKGVAAVFPQPFSGIHLQHGQRPGIAVHPFLGFRAIRYCLAREDLYRTQLRALLRASAFGDVEIMVPLVGDLKEFHFVKDIIVRTADEIIQQAFSVQPKDNRVFLPGVMSRKKQVIPMLTDLWG